MRGKDAFSASHSNNRKFNSRFSLLSLSLSLSLYSICMLTYI
ncbi:hypothetical protein OAV88_00175 [bacterium]|nr:hypothetical protein [bacterium]